MTYHTIFSDVKHTMTKGTTYETEEEEQPPYSANVNVPSKEALQINLAPIELMDQFKQYRDDESFFSDSFFTIAGAIIGLIIDWALSGCPTNIVPSIVILALLIGAAIYLYMTRKKYKTRTSTTISKINKYRKETPLEE